MRYLLFALLLAGPVAAAPIVPNFKTGTTTSHTESKTQITEKIHSVDFATGYTYSASGTNITTDKSVVPSAMPTQTQTVEGVKSSWTGFFLATLAFVEASPEFCACSRTRDASMSTKNWSISPCDMPSAAFPFLTEIFITNPSLKNKTLIFQA